MFPSLENLCLEAVFLPQSGISLDFEFFKVLNCAKGKIFGAEKLSLLPALLKHCSQEALIAAV